MNCTTTPPAPVRHFASLAHYHDHMQWRRPRHPLLSVLNGARDYDDLIQTPAASTAVSTDCYVIKIVNFRANHMRYGRGYYDFQSGSLVLMAPQQVMSWHDVDWPNEIDENTYIMLLHRDFFLPSARHALPISSAIRDYPFFEYYNNEALHISDSEQQTLQSLFRLIEAEYHADSSDDGIILALVGLVLQYAERFYQRQFASRNQHTGLLLPLVKQCLHDYYSKPELVQQHGLPSVAWIAAQLAVSPRYLNDALKWETAMTAQDHLHAIILDKAKAYLLEPDSNVAQVAYRLGFEYPQYFSRLFKRKLHISPSAFQQQQSAR